MNARTRLLLTATSLAVLSAPVPSEALVAAIEERVVLEARIVEPYPAHMRATMRVRRFVTMGGGYGAGVAGDLDQQSVTIELCDAVKGCGDPADLRCFTAMPSASMRVDVDDSGWAKATGPGCSLEVNFAGSGTPFAVTNGIEFGYKRPAKIRSATIGGGIAVLEDVTLRRLRGAHAG
jgi:hypothetical protein